MMRVGGGGSSHLAQGWRMVAGMPEWVGAQVHMSISQPSADCSPPNGQEAGQIIACLSLSLSQVDTDTGLILSHVDFWDALEHNK